MRHQSERHCSQTLPIPLPQCTIERSALIVARRTAQGGNQDARAAVIAMHAFGVSFRRPLTLLRCLVHEIAHTSNRRIRLAPCCAAGLTRDEGLIMAALRGEGLAPLVALTDNEDCSNLLPIAEMLRAEFRLARLARQRRT